MVTLSHRWLVLTAGLVTVLSMASPMTVSAASGARTLSNMPMGYFDEQDLSMMQEAVIAVLEDENAEATRDWSNEKSGHSGKASSLRAYQSAEGRRCKTLRIDNSAEGYKSSMRYDICLYADGQWREAESGVPFGKALNPGGLQ